MANTSVQAAATGSQSGSDKGSRDADDLSAQIATLRKDLAGLTELVGEIGTRRGKDAKRKVEEKAGEMRLQGEELLHEAGRRAAQYEDAAIGQIRANPFQAVGIAAAAGFLLGYLNARR
ncbi:DUF883 domain-containing protein [Salipiger thiooxidans]|jgi:ElaB/YqjD/DUF883 family membrane-anchored ribosome-binding protein|uniref:DUF883 family protein n=1 Tax=Salipiger thiooxidans TaxID=282683 RepID=UPI001A8D1FA9|nr:DUF883 family protein [Salipiger thiooxidans]MBN8185596.1 DUF883 domain-containing protein [Salipiger thiooxidans]